MLTEEKGFGAKHWRYSRLFIFITFLFLANGLYAQTGLADGDVSFFSLDGGFGMSDTLVSGTSYGLILDPKLRLTPHLLIGNRSAINYSTDGIISLETQGYLRWNFLRLGASRGTTTDIFIQGGAGFIGAIKGPDYVEGSIEKNTRASLLFDGTLGVTIPLSSRWHIELSGRGGYPFIWGFSITAGYRFPLRRTVYQQLPPRTEYVEVIRTLPPNEIIKRIMINQVEYIIFGADTSKYDEGIDADARSLNDLVLNEIAQILKQNPDFRVRIEGHANPVNHRPEEIEELLTLSANRANETARLLRERGVAEEQIVVVAYGGTRVVTGDREHWNMNRRVELVVIQVDVD